MIRPLRWLSPGLVLYSGPLARPVLHHGYDGWKATRDAPMERVVEGWVAAVPTEGRLVVDCVIRSGDQCDNNHDADYRLWIGLDPVDAHVHARAPGDGPLGFGSLRAAAYSGGMTEALVSWQDNDFVEIAAAALDWLTPLVWVRPGGPDPADVRRRLAAGAVGLKLHPAYDGYPADTPGLDPYLRVAAEAGVPVTVHSGPGPADPDLIRRLAARFPEVRFVLYHTFLGHDEGRRRAARHARALPNLYLETSWCGADTTRRLIDEVGPDRVLFGSDAATDGPLHFVRRPPNIEGASTYNETLLALAKRLEPPVTRKLLEDNARALFGLPRPSVTRDDLPALLDTAAATMERLISSARPAQMTLPTPCARWDVRALIKHVREARDNDAVDVPWGRVPAPVALSGRVLELTAHAWDLATALGDRTPLDPGLAGAALRIATRLVPPELRDDATFGRPVAYAGTDPGTRLAAYLGRRV